MLSYRNYEPGDIEKVDARYEVIGPDNLSDYHLENSHMRTFYSGDKILGVMAHTMIWPGLGEAWVHVSEDIRGHGMSLVRNTKRILEEDQRIYNVRRTNALIHEDRYEYLKWVKLLGFVGESFMPKAAPDGKGLFLMVKWRLN